MPLAAFLVTPRPISQVGNRFPPPRLARALLVPPFRAGLTNQPPTRLCRMPPSETGLLVLIYRADHRIQAINAERRTHCALPRLIPVYRN
jgi:hypothetical protein